MKAILLSIRPKWVEKILKGKKTIEVRKTAPMCDLPIDVYIYATKYKHDWVIKDGVSVYDDWVKINGKVVARFTLKRLEVVFNHSANTPFPPYDAIRCQSQKAKNDEFLKQSCLTQKQVTEYIGKDNIGWSWRIDDLAILDEPLPLDAFKVRRAPQNWQYVEVAP